MLRINFGFLKNKTGTDFTINFPLKNNIGSGFPLIYMLIVWAYWLTHETLNNTMYNAQYHTCNAFYLHFGTMSDQPSIQTSDSLTRASSHCKNRRFENKIGVSWDSIKMDESFAFTCLYFVFAIIILHIRKALALHLIWLVCI